MEIYGLEEFNWAAGGLAILAFPVVWWYLGYMDMGYGFVMKTLMGILAVGFGYFAAAWQLEKD